MGKAGILVVPVTIIVIALIIWGIIWMIGRTPQEPKSLRKKAELTDAAYDVFRTILHPRNIDDLDVTILSNSDKAAVRSWIEKYGKVI